MAMCDASSMDAVEIDEHALRKHARHMAALGWGLTANQLHRMAWHIKELAELSRKLSAARKGNYSFTGCRSEVPQPKERQKNPHSRSARKPRVPRRAQRKAGPKKRQRAEVKQEPEEDAGGSDDSGSEPEEASLSDSDAPDTEPSGVGSDAESEPGKKAKPRKAGRKQQAAASRTTPRRLSKVARKTKQKASDDEDAGAEAEASEAEGGISTGPAQLAALKALPYVPREQELCDVCGSGEGWDGNAILLCDGRGCKVALHQQCCGIADIPEGDWLCDGCEAAIKPEAHACLVCPVSGGALRRVASSGPVKLPEGVSLADGAWVHLACAVWTPEVQFENPAEMQCMRLDDLTADRTELRCGICKQGGGSAVQCCFGKCTRAFHILCARQRGNITAVRPGDAALLCFCEMHSKERFAKSRAKMLEELPGGSHDELANEADEAPPAEPNEYEQQRERNIARNKARLAELRSM